MDCRRFSDRSRGLVLLFAGALLAGGCATVKPQDKELLADPAMTYGSGSANRQEQHVLENREGSSAAAAAGGGCGCN